MQLINKTPFASQLFVMPNIQGIDTLHTLVKASFNIGSRWTLADEQIPPQSGDEYWDDPSNSSLKHPNEFHQGKPFTDINIIGQACAPDYVPTKQIDVGVSVGNIQKVLRVFGNRYWNNGYISPAESFESLSLSYENAFGGQHLVDGKIKSLERRNPVGKGYRGKQTRTEMHGQELPNIEDPKQLIQDISHRPEPAGFGCRAPHWMPRANLGGTYDEHWQSQRAPYLPTDYNPQFQNSASPGLIYPAHLLGNEPVKIVNMHPKGVVQFTLPALSLQGVVLVGGQGPEKLRFALETLTVEVSDLILRITWHSSYTLGNRIANVREVQVNLNRGAAQA